MSNSAERKPPDLFKDVYVIWCYPVVRPGEAIREEVPLLCHHCALNFHFSDQNSPNEKDEIRPGRTSTPRLTKSGDSFEKVDLSTLQRLDSEIYDNQGTSDWDGEESELELSGRLKNKTIEELRRDSVSSIKKPSSPLRRISSPLTRSGRFSIVSITSRRSHNKSVDLGSEGVSLIMSPDNRESSESSSSPLHASPKLAVDSAGEFVCNV